MEDVQMTLLDVAPGIVKCDGIPVLMYVSIMSDATSSHFLLAEIFCVRARAKRL